MNALLRLMVILLLLTATAQAEPFTEMNAQRAHLGLPPLIRDADLMRKAQKRAEWLAVRQIHSGPDYYGHRGANWGPGIIEGIGSLYPDWGWCTCAMRTIGQHRAGAGMVVGTDGRRYMVLLIRGSNLLETQIRRPLRDTSHMTPDPVRVQR